MGDSVRLLTVHGTGNGEPAEEGQSKHWWEPGSEFMVSCSDALLGYGLSSEQAAFRWSGANSMEERIRAAQDLADDLVSTDIRTVIVAHSHGGNVALDGVKLATEKSKGIASKVRGLICVGTPFLRWEFKPWRYSFSKVREHVGFFSTTILVGFVFGAIAFSAVWEGGEAPMAYALFLVCLAITALTLFWILFRFSKYVRASFNIRNLNVNYKEAVNIRTIIHPDDEAYAALNLAFDPHLDFPVDRVVTRNNGSIFLLSLIISGIPFWFFSESLDPLTMVFAPIIYVGVVYYILRAMRWIFAKLIRRPVNTLVASAIKDLAFGEGTHFNVTQVSLSSGAKLEHRFHALDDWDAKIEGIIQERAGYLLGRVRGELSSSIHITQVFDRIVAPESFDCLIHTSYFESGGSSDAILQELISIVMEHD